MKKKDSVLIPTFISIIFDLWHLFYNGENRSILDTYFTMEKGINIGQLFYYGEDGSILDTITLF